MSFYMRVRSADQFGLENLEEIKVKILAKLNQLPSSRAGDAGLYRAYDFTEMVNRLQATY